MEVNGIAQYLFDCNTMGMPRQAKAALRNCYVFFQSNNSVTRGEALQKAELSDLLDIILQLPP
jgi:hypothetical protein